jgi:hypothetical protein
MSDAASFLDYIRNHKPRDPYTTPLYELQWLYPYHHWTEEQFRAEVERRKYNAKNGKTNTPGIS